MRSRVRYLCIALACIAGPAPSTAMAADAAPVAGLAPNLRPATAPVINEIQRGDAWRATALRGVTRPVPESIARAIDSQGAWYTPFTRPGMPGPYDLRGMHAAQPKAVPPQQAAP